MSDKRIDILKNMDTGKAITKLAIPAIVGFMVMAIYNVADTLFVSWWNPKGAGAVQIIFPVMMIASAIGLMFGIGGGSYISRLLGQNNLKKANSVVSTNIFTAIIIGIIYVVVCIFSLENIVKMFGANGDMIELSVNYGFFIIIGSFFVIQSMILNNALRAEGSAKYSMIGMGFGSLLNIAIDPVFIFVFKMGLNGAALATMLSQAISCLILYQFYFRKKTIIKIHLKYFEFDLGIYREVLKIGLPTFFRQILFSISMGLLNKSASLVGGDYLLSAFGIAFKFTSIGGFFIFGMGQGLQPVVGYNYGAKNIKRVLSAQRHGMIRTFAITLIWTSLFILFAKQIMFVFTSEAQVIKYGVPFIIALSVALIFMAISNTIAVVFQAIGNGRISMLLSILRQGVFLIPSIIILPRLLGYWGVILSQLSADILTVAISLVIYIPFLKREKRILLSDVNNKLI